MGELIILHSLCVVVLGVIFIALLLQKAQKDKVNKHFMTTIIFAIIFGLTNLISEAVEGIPDLTIVNYIASYISFIAVDFASISFSFYVYSLMERSTGIHYSSINIVTISSLMRMFITLALSMSGNLFSIVDGYYTPGDLEFIPYIFSFGVIIELICVVLMNRKLFKKRQLIIIILYQIIPIIPVIIELIFNTYSMTDASFVVSCLLIYIFLQDSAIEQGKLKQQMLEEISSQDFLTGLLNRRAYYNRLLTIKPDSSIGVLFCDLNGLKYFNDNYGHDKGDELIKQFSNILSEHLNHNDIFRISGDEYVVILENMKYDEFLRTEDLIKISIITHNNIASIGSSYGNSNNIEKLIKDAEQKMYEDKKLNGKNRLSYYDKTILK